MVSGTPAVISVGGLVVVAMEVKHPVLISGDGDGDLGCDRLPDLGFISRAVIGVETQGGLSQSFPAGEQAASRRSSRAAAGFSGRASNIVSL
jgi:hypothetical protein